MEMSEKVFNPNNTSMIETGTKVPVGQYICTQCSDKIKIVTKDGTKLPSCSKCGHTYWMKF